MTCLGSEFIEILKIFYPKAVTFQEEDFDWLFDCPQTEQFLEWFCNTVGEENILNSTELEIYEKLMTSKKPILEGEALEQALKTCHHSSQLKDVIQENEFPSLDALEQEMEMLRRQRARWIKRRNKLQIQEASLKQDLCHTAEKKEKSGREMNKAYLQLQLENFQSNRVLSQVCEMGKMLIKWYRDPLIQKAWTKELDQSEEETLRIEAPALIESSQGVLKTQTEVALVKPPKDEELCSYPKELGHMQLAYINSQTGVVMTSAEIQGLSSALKWAGICGVSCLHLLQVEEEKRELCLLIAACQEQLHNLQSEICQAKEQKLLPLIQGGALLFCLPVISGEFNLEVVRLGHLEATQEKAVNHILCQLSHLEFLKFLVMQEQKNVQEMEIEVKEVVTFLRELQAKLQEWLSCFGDSKSTMEQCPRTLIDPNDFTMLRREKQLFRAYETLASRSSRLCQELRLLQAQLAVPPFQFPKLESDTEALYYMMYGDTNQLMLHAQELSEPLEQLGSTQAKLYQMLMDALSDVKAKYKSLQSHFQQTERNLYIYFFNDPDQLKEVIHEIEKQTLAFSDGKL
uniref:HAUS augmin-like complex subunit 3 N-terminal domain-containing protein n=1 Tax=Salvator merianae TaxID=96440 RepID=A0A8D0BRB9_SALMN